MINHDNDPIRAYALYKKRKTTKPPITFLWVDSKLPSDLITELILAMKFCDKIY